MLITEAKVDEIVVKHKEIIVFGAGKVGTVIVEYLLCKNADILCDVVTDESKNPMHIYGIPVLEIGRVKNYAYATIIVATAERFQGEIREILKGMNFAEIYYVSEEFYEKSLNEVSSGRMKKQFQYNLSRRYCEPYLNVLGKSCKGDDEKKSKICEGKLDILKGKKNKNKLYLPRVVVVLGTKCSLRCKECNNLMPYFKPAFDLNTQKVMSSVKQLAKLADKILRLELIGGEPFLSKNLAPVLEQVIDIPQIEIIEITTNGKNVPQDKEIVTLLKNSRVKVRISDYGDIVNKTPIIEFCKKENICYEVLELGNWISAGNMEKRNKRIEQLRKEYARCPSGYFCKTLYEDRLFSCARAASLYALGSMQEDEYVQIGAETTPADIKEFILKDYSVACDYCDMQSDNCQFIEPAEQLEY